MSRLPGLDRGRGDRPVGALDRKDVLCGRLSLCRSPQLARRRSSPESTSRRRRRRRSHRMTSSWLEVGHKLRKTEGGLNNDVVRRCDARPASATRSIRALVRRALRTNPPWDTFCPLQAATCLRHGLQSFMVDAHRRVRRSEPIGGTRRRYYACTSYPGPCQRKAGARGKYVTFLSLSRKQSKLDVRRVYGGHSFDTY